MYLVITTMLKKHISSGAFYFILIENRVATFIFLLISLALICLSLKNIVPTEYIGYWIGLFSIFIGAGVANKHRKGKNSNSHLTPIEIRSFPEDFRNNKVDETLDLTKFFDTRYIKKEKYWNNEIYNELNNFISKRNRKNSYGVYFEAHLSIVFMVGRLLNYKKGIDAFPIQKHDGLKKWDPDNETYNKSNLWNIEEKDLNNKGGDVALVIGITRKILYNVVKFIENKQLNIEQIAYFEIKENIGVDAVKNGAHGKKLANELSNVVSEKNFNDKRIHIFASCPSGFMYYLGQRLINFNKITLYEHDFDKKTGDIYFKSFELPVE